MRTVFVLFFISLTAIFSWAFDPNENQLTEEIPTQIYHSKNGEIHQLVFPNFLSIPKENYTRFFQRIQQVYPTIQVLIYHEDRQEFELHFFIELPTSDVLNNILTKFSIKHYSILHHD